MLIIRVSKTADQRHEQLIAVHELIECLCCHHDGVSQQAVDDYDMGPGAESEDPGSDVAAPYHVQHMTATAVEVMLAHALGVGWRSYEATIEGL